MTNQKNLETGTLKDLEKEFDEIYQESLIENDGEHFCKFEQPCNCIRSPSGKEPKQFLKKVWNEAQLAQRKTDAEICQEIIINSNENAPNEWFEAVRCCKKSIENQK